jgi:hypothetical protein
MVKKRSYATAANKDDDELYDDNDNEDELCRCVVVVQRLSVL